MFMESADTPIEAHVTPKVLLCECGYFLVFRWRCLSNYYLWYFILTHPQELVWPSCPILFSPKKHC